MPPSSRVSKGDGTMSASRRSNNHCVATPYRTVPHVAHLPLCCLHAHSLGKLVLGYRNIQPFVYPLSLIDIPANYQPMVGTHTSFLLVIPSDLLIRFITIL